MLLPVFNVNNLLYSFMHSIVLFVFCLFCTREEKLTLHYQVIGNKSFTENVEYQHESNYLRTF